MKKTAADASASASAAEQIDARIAELGDWRGETLARLRAWIHAAVPAVVETWKWKGTPVWECNGILCTGETYKGKVKLTFAKGASLPDPAGLFNASLEGNARRAIDLAEGEMPDEAAFQALMQAAAALNATGASAKEAKKQAAAARPARSSRAATALVGGEAPVLLSGGNPQIAKADGDAPVQAYLAAMPDWRQGIGRRLDAMVMREVPAVVKAVRWNSPFYGIAGQGWFMSFHTYARYVKVTFFQGVQLDPPPPGGKDPAARWIDLHEKDLGDPDIEKQVADWIRQAAALPGWGKS